MAKLNLTSVKIIPPEYKKFKVACIESNFNLQKLVNRCLVLYNTDNDFRIKIESFELEYSGSIL